MSTTSRRRERRSCSRACWQRFCCSARSGRTSAWTTSSAGTSRCRRTAPGRRRCSSTGQTPSSSGRRSVVPPRWRISSCDARHTEPRSRRVSPPARSSAVTTPRRLACALPTQRVQRQRATCRPLAPQPVASRARSASESRTRCSDRRAGRSSCDSHLSRSSSRARTHSSRGCGGATRAGSRSRGRLSSPRRSSRSSSRATT